MLTKTCMNIILFIIYANDMTNVFSNPSKMYADDTKIQAKIRKNFEGQDTLTMQRGIIRG